MLENIAYQFKAGGTFMWIILGVLAFVIAIIIERIIYLFILNSKNEKNLIKNIQEDISSKNLENSLNFLAKRKDPKGKLLYFILYNYKNGSSIEEIIDNLEAISIKELQKLSNRLNYLSLSANISTLLGLLGTIIGLQISFNSLAGVEAAKKAVLLAKGISVAMNTTAFGLIVAIIAMIFYTILSNRKNDLLTDIDENVITVINLLKKEKNVN